MESTAGRATSTTRRATATGRSVAPTTTVRRTNTAGRGATTVHTASTSVASPTASSEPQPGGLSGGAIGGIAAGVVVVLAALAGLLVYKRRKRYGAAKKDGSQDEPMYMHASNYSRKKGPPDNGISGPLALAPETDVGAAPSPFPPPRSRPEQEPRHAGPSHAGGNEHSGMYGRDGQDDHLSSNRGHGGNNTPLNDRQPFQDDYYDDNLVHDYYSSPPEPHVGARRTPAEARDMPQGNITPAPEYYLGKEDIDPLRDLRGLDSPEAYLRDKKSPPMPSSLAQVEQRVEPHPSLDSPRSSFSSDASSEYLTLEQAQKAHQKKMMGHKESIGSHQILMDKHHQGQKPQGQLLSPTTPSFAPDHASMAISDSTMSMMPSLPPNSSTMSFSPQHSNSGMHSRQGSDSRTQASYPSTPILNGGKGNPGGGRGYQGAGHDDPYAESAYSEDFTDHRSLISSSPYQPPYSGGGHPPPPGRAYSPYSKSPHSPYGPGFQQGGGGYRNNGPGYPGSPPFNGYGTRPQQPMRGPGGGGGGYGPPQGRNGPGYGPPRPGRGGPHHYSPSHNGYHPGMEGSPGSGSSMPYDHHQQQRRDPGYNQSSYSRAY